MKIKLIQLIWMLVLVCLLVPIAPTMPEGGNDASWMYAMNQAVAQELAFGQDIVFTFGPYAGVYTNTYHPATDLMVLIGGLHLAMAYALALWHLFSDRQWRWFDELVFILALILLGYSKDAVLFTCPLLVGLAIHATDSEMRVQGRTSWLLSLRLAAICTPLGLLPLIKGSMWPLCVLVLLAIAYRLIRFRQWRQLFLVCVSPALCMVVYWLASGQPLWALQAYFQAMVPIISGYTSALSWDGSRQEVVTYLLLSVLVLAGLWKNEKSLVSGRLWLLMACLFMVFKAAYVRHDGHGFIGAVFVFFAATLARLISHPMKRGQLNSWGMGLATVFLLFSVVVYGSNFSRIKDDLAEEAVAKGFEYHDFKKLPKRQQASILWNLIGPSRLFAIIGSNIHAPISFEAIAHSLKLRSQDPSALPAAFDETNARLRRELPLPRLPGKSDIYSYNHSYLIASGNEWHPRPVFQSYSAYTPALALRNLKHLTAIDAPDQVFFRVEPVDARLPSIEDGISWHALLHTYQPVRLQQDFLQLQRANTLASPPLKKHSSVMVRMGHAVRVPNVASLLYAEMHIKPTAKGRLLNLFFKPGQVKVTLHLKDGSRRLFRLVPGMMETGVLLSPLVENTADFAMLYWSPHRLETKQVVSMTLESEGSWPDWQEYVEVIFKVDHLSPVRPVSDFSMNFDTLVTPQALGMPVASITQCHGQIKSINGINPEKGNVSMEGVMSINGWTAKPVIDRALPKSVWIVLTDSQGQVLAYLKTRRIQEGKSSSLTYKFSTFADLHEFHGRVFLGMAHQDGSILKHCSGGKIALNIRPASSFTQ